MEKRIYAQIVNVSLQIICHDDEVYHYVLRELEMHQISKSVEQPNIVVNVRNESFSKNDKMICIDKNVYIDGSRQFICVEAHFRRTWIVISGMEKGSVHIDVFLDKRNTKIKRLCTPNFQYPWQNTLIDFFHGVFLWFLEYYLLKSDVTLIHAAAFIYNGRGILLNAGASAGKSTIVDQMSLLKNTKYIAEDYCILDAQGKIYGLFNQRRIFTCPKDCKTLMDFLNYILFSLTKCIGSESIRIRCTRELFETDAIVKECNDYRNYFLERNSKKETETNRVCECIKIMEHEVCNWDGSIQFLNAFNNMYPEWNIKSTFFDKLKVVMKNNLTVCEMKTIFVPYMKTKELFLGRLIEELERE